MVNVAAAWLLNQKGEVLICRRAPSEPRPGFWEFPGGKFEDGEDGPAALKRELREELDLAVHQVSLIAVREHTYATGSFRIHLYSCLAEEEKEPILTVHDDWRWAKPEELADFNFLPGDIPLIEDILRRYHGSINISTVE